MDFKHTSIKQSALGWVKKSIDDNLANIRAELNGFIESKDSSVLESVIAQLNDIRGVLAMVEQYGAAVLTEEMGSLCRFIADKEQVDETALEVLLRAVLQLPDYLEHIQAGNKDIPIAILPLLNDIRAAKNEDLFSEKLLFLPDLSMHMDESEYEAIDDGQNQNARLLAKKVRPAYQFALLGVIRDQDLDTHLKRLSRIAEVFEERSVSEQMARFWWIVGALIESVAQGDLSLGVSVKSLMGKVDSVMRAMMLGGERKLLKQQPIELIKNLLYYIAQPECDGPKSQAIKTAYRLEQFLPPETSGGEATGAIAGPNQELLRTVSDAIQADLEQVKSSLEVYVNDDLSKTERLAEIPAALHIISDTLAMIGLGPQREMVERQIRMVKEIIAGSAEPDQDKLLGMAAELIQIDQALELMQKGQLGDQEESSAQTGATSRNFEMDNVLSAVVTAALDDIQKIKDAILDFIKDSTKEENITLCQTLLMETRGAMDLLNQTNAVKVVDGLVTYLREQDIVEFMDTNHLDQLSQVVVAIEYFLEALGEQRDDTDSILAFASTQLGFLLEGKSAPSPAEEGDFSDTQNLLIDETGSVQIIDEAELEDVDLSNMEADLGGDEEPEQEVAESLELQDIEPQPEIALELEETEQASEGVQQDEAFDGESALVVDEISEGLEDIQVVLEGVESGDLQVVETDELESASEQVVEEVEFESLLEPEELELADDEEALLEEVGEETSFELEEVAPVETVQEVQEEAAEQVVIQPVEDDQPVLKPGTDEEILEIYLEEAEEETENIQQQQRDWKLHPEDENALKNIRRSFHTIKGSGRLVGAMKIGEFAWDFENLLNRVIDNTVPPTEQVIDAIGLAGEALPQLVEEIKTQEQPSADVAYLRGLARALAEFKAHQVLQIRESMQQKAEALSEAEQVPVEEQEAAGAELADEIELEQLDTAAIAEEPALEVETDEVAEEPELEIETDEVAEEPELEIETDEVAEEPELEIETDEVAEEPELELETDEVAAEPELEIETVEVAEALEEPLDVEALQAETELPDQALDVADSIADEVVTEAPAEAESDDSTEPEVINAEETPPDPFVLSEVASVPGEEAGQPLPAEQSEATDLQIDPELLVIYRQEVESHLSTVNSVLEKSVEDGGGLVPTEDLYRALHTINGASRTADITTIGSLATLLEKPLKIIVEQGGALDAEALELYRRGHQAIHDMTTELVDHRRMPEVSADLERDLQELLEQMDNHTIELPEQNNQPSSAFVDTLTMMNESPEPEHDDELVQIFIEEATDLLEMSDHALQSWAEQDEDEDAPDYGLVMELQRYLHTLKGGARMADISAISDLSHELESLFIAVIDSRIDKSDELVDALHDSFDLLQRQVEQTRNHEALDLPDECIAQIHQLRGIKPSSSQQDKQSGPGAELAEAEANGAVTAQLGQQPHADLQNGNNAGDEERDRMESRQERRASDRDVVKVRSELLDNLVNSAGEVSIYRARMEQQVSSFGGHLGELGQTIIRLKKQLRDLEAETDAQIHFSHRQDAELEKNFDPLEMDRYTQIQELSKSLSESVDDLSSLQGILGEQVKDSETLLLQQSRINTDLQDGLIRSRMVRFSGLASRLRRLVRQTNGELGKKTELKLKGEHNEVDIKVLDRMVAPLEHIIRNAISHGIESPMERVNKGKPETGTILIEVSRDGSDVVVRVSDDGAGIQVEKVRSRALELGLLKEDEQLEEHDIVQFILEPGFSTADQVSQVAGRGVGMDVVDTGIKQLGGALQISTSPNGTVFTARLPFTLSINQAILVRAGEESYALPLINIEGITRIEADQLADLYQQDKPILDYAGQQYSLNYLSILVDVSNEYVVNDPLIKLPVILLRSGDLRVALHIDEILGNREIVVKPLGKQLSQVKGLSGASILADGSVVLILDINGLIRHGMSTRVVTQELPDLGLTQAIEPLRKTVMVVDDSITMRRVATKLLTRNHYDVVTAKDGVDALAQLEERSPDVMLLDIEMPRMDGFELASHMRNEARYRNIPIIMITSRTGTKHRDHAMEIGVNKYMGKPYQEAELIENIAQLVS